jgi:hypothetical protein
MKFGMICVATAIVVAGFFSSPTDAAEQSAATGAEMSCLASLKTSGRMIADTRDVTLGPIQWHDRYNPVTGSYENVGRSLNWGVTVKGFGVGIAYTDRALGGVCPSYKTVVDDLVEKLNLESR